MDKFVIPTKGQDNNSINRTIRFSSENFGRLMDCVENTGVTFNRIVNECVKFALDRFEKIEKND